MQQSPLSSKKFRVPSIDSMSDDIHAEKVNTLIKKLQYDETTKNKKMELEINNLQEQIASQNCQKNLQEWS